MTDRTCGTCAWWDEMESHPGVGQCRYVAPTRVDDEAPWPLTGPSDWCRYHATTRGWGNEEQRESDKPLFAHVMDENARLKARCQEARELLETGTPPLRWSEKKYGLWLDMRSAWLEGSDESDKPLFAHVMDENARLKARCREIREKCQSQSLKSDISSYLHFPDEIKALAEGSDDA